MMAAKRGFSNSRVRSTFTSQPSAWYCKQEPSPSPHLFIYRYGHIDFYFFQCFQIHYCIFVLKFSLIWPVRASSSLHLCLCNMPLSYFWALLSGRTSCSRLILYLSCLSRRIGHFSKKPSFLSVHSIVFRNQVLGTAVFIAIRMSLLLGNVCV